MGVSRMKLMVQINRMDRVLVFNVIIIMAWYRRVWISVDLDDRNSSDQAVSSLHQAAPAILTTSSLAAMATTAVQNTGTTFSQAAGSSSSASTIGGAKSNASGISSFYASKISQYQLSINDKTHNLRRLEAQRNQLNSRVRLLREEMQLLQEPGSHVGEIIKVMSKKKVLVKVQPEGKYGEQADVNAGDYTRAGH